jgi:hypothetical protein
MPGTHKTVYIAYTLHPDPKRPSKNPVGDCLWNIRATTDICLRLLKECPNLLILSPIHAFLFVGPFCSEAITEKILEQRRRLLALADELWVYGDYETSEGCQMEIAYATALGKPVVYKKREQ